MEEELSLPEHLRLGSGPGGSWCLEPTLEWCGQHFFDLIRLVPQCMEPYLGSDEDGVTIRRYAFCELPSAEEEEEAAAAAAAAAATAAANREETAEEKEKRLENERIVAEKREAERRKAAREAQLRDNAAKKKKEEALRRAELGLEPLGKPAQGPRVAKLTRKEKAGSRTSKTGPRRKKFDAEAAAEKMKGKKKKKKKKT